VVPAPDAPVTATIGCARDIKFVYSLFNLKVNFVHVDLNLCRSLILRIINADQKL
jgi:hypothetical protein